MKLLSALISRAQLISKLGLQFGGDRDLYSAYGYKKALVFNDFMARYTRQDIAGRVVDAPAQATWEQHPQVLENLEPEITQFEQAFSDLAMKLKLWHYLERVDRLAGIGRYAILYIGGPGSPSSPLTRGDILYLSVYTEENAQIGELDSDKLSPRFGLPLFYNVDFSQDTQLSSRTEKVHWSRVIHVAEGLVEDEVFGRPRLERVYNLLDDLQKVVGGSGEMFWQGAYRGIQADVDKDMILDADDEAALSDEVDEYVHGLRRWIRTRGVEIKALESSISDPRGSFSVIMSLISGTTGIPQRILMGSEQGQLASEQDERNWNSRVKERQKSFAEVQVLRPFIERCQIIRVLPEADYEIVWPDLMTLTDESRAMVAVRISQSVKNVADHAGSVITAGEFRKEYLGLPPDNTDLNEFPEPKDPVRPPDNESLPKRRDDIDESV